MGNIFSRLSGNNINNASNRRVSKTDYNSGNQRSSGLKAEISANAPIAQSEPFHSTPFREIPDPTPLKPKSPKPKPAEITAPPKEQKVYTTTFEAQVDAAPPHPLEEKLNQDIQFDEVEIETNLFTPEVEDAVIKIQAGIRGYLARKQVKELKKDNEEVGDINRLVADREETPIVPPPQLFDDSKAKTIEELLQSATDVSNQLTKIEFIDNQNLCNYSDKKITNESKGEKIVLGNNSTLDNESTGIESEENKLKESLSSLTDGRPLDIDIINNNNIEPNKNPIIENETQFVSTLQTKDNGNVEELVNKSQIPLLKTKSEKAVEKLKELTENKSLDKDPILLSESIKSVDNINESIESKAQEKVTENIIQLNECKPEEEIKLEEKTIEEQVVDMLFDEEINVNDNKVVAIELFKQDVSEHDLAKVKTISEPETKKSIEDRVYKTSLDQFVVKPVEQKPEPKPILEPLVNSSSPDLDIESVPILEEQKIEIISTNSRKNSYESQEVSEELNGELNGEVHQMIEVLPNSQPLIQVEEQNGAVLDEEEAAIRIQAAFRGYQIRRSLSREASPNRSPNNANTDNNQQIQSQLSQDLFLNNNQSEPLIEFTNERHDYYGHHSLENQQINDSLERLEDQLLQQLISSDENNEEFNESKLHPSEQPVENIVQKSDFISMNEPIEANQTQEEVRIIEQTFPQAVPEEAQALNDGQSLPNISEDNKNLEICLKEKSNDLHFDARIVDFSQLNPNDSQNIEIDTNQNPSNDNNGETLNQINTVNQNNDIQTIDFLENIKENLEDYKITTESNNDKLIEIESKPSVLKQDEAIPSIQTSSETLETNPISTQTQVEIPESQVQTCIEPPTPADLNEITPQTMFISPEKPVLTKISSSESEQEPESMKKHEKASHIPRKKMGLDLPQKQLHGILKETDSHIHSNLSPEEQTQSTSEEISSPDDDPDFVGLGPNTPIPVRASSPNPFGKKRRKGRKSGGRKN